MIVPEERRMLAWEETFTSSGLYLDNRCLEADKIWIYNTKTESFEHLVEVDRYKQAGELFIPEGKVLDLLDPVVCPPGTTRQMNMLVHGEHGHNKRHHSWGGEAFNVCTEDFFQMEDEKLVLKVLNQVRDNVHERSDVQLVHTRNLAALNAQRLALSNHPEMLRQEFGIVSRAR